MGIGSRLRQARKMRRFSQERIGKAVGVTKQAISKYEKDKDMPGAEILRGLAQALGVREEFFFRFAPEVELDAVQYRKHSRLPAGERRAVLTKAQDCLERYLQVEELVPENRSASFSIRETPPRQVASFDEVEEGAEEIRTAWNLGLDPIENLMEVLEENGIKVFLIESADERFDALTFRVNGATPVIAVRRDVEGDRQRFSVAHELAHLLLKPVGTLDAEKAANRFAGAFLIPQSAVYMELGRHRSALDLREVYLLKHKYGASMQTWIRRARDLRTISEATYRSLCMLFSRNNWRRREPGDQVPSERPGRMERLVARTIAEDVISQSRGAELLGRQLWELRKEIPGNACGAGNTCS